MMKIMNSSFVEAGPLNLMENQENSCGNFTDVHFSQTEIVNDKRQYNINTVIFGKFKGHKNVHVCVFVCKYIYREVYFILYWSLIYFKLQMSKYLKNCFNS